MYIWIDRLLLQRCSCKKINTPWRDMKMKLIYENPDIKDAPVNLSPFICPQTLSCVDETWTTENKIVVCAVHTGTTNKHTNPYTLNWTEGSTESVGESGETWCCFCKPAKSWKDRQILELRINQGLSPLTVAQIEIESGGEVAMNSAWLHIMGHLTSCC